MQALDRRRLRVPASGLLAAILGLAGFFGGLPAQSQPLPALPWRSGPVEIWGSAKPTHGWVDFCSRLPAECAIDATEPALVELTPTLWKSLNAVNRDVNATIKPLTDLDHWGVIDRWDIPDCCGDCEDYQLLKRKRLAAAGVPRRAMRMTVVVDQAGEGHAVMMVRTDRGDFILDNKRDAVLPWHQTGYVYVKQEGAQANMTWAHLGGATSPAATANR